MGFHSILLLLFLYDKNVSINSGKIRRLSSEKLMANLTKQQWRNYFEILGKNGYANLTDIQSVQMKSMFSQSSMIQKAINLAKNLLNKYGTGKKLICKINIKN